MTLAETAGPPAHLRFRRRLGPRAVVRDLWAKRMVLVTLAERDLRARYKQSFLGAAWAVMTPLFLMVVFNLFVRRVTTVTTHGVPYQLFSYVGLLPWTFYSSALTSGGQSLVGSQALLNKIACPREVFPLAQVATSAFNSLIAAGVLLVLFGVHGFAPRATAVWAPVPLAVLAAFTVGTTLFVSSVVVYVRDVRHALPIAMQLGLFATPVAYGMEAIPARWHDLYAVLNPLGPVIETLRRTVLFGVGPDWSQLGPAAAASLAWLVAGWAVFKRLEVGFADVA